MKKIRGLNFALSRLDDLGGMLDRRGITTKVNRHNVIACALNTQKRLEGELDSLHARLGARFPELSMRLEEFEARVRHLVGQRSVRAR